MDILEEIAVRLPVTIETACTTTTSTVESGRGFASAQETIPAPGPARIDSSSPSSSLTVFGR
jgi:hypothetical protein